MTYRELLQQNPNAPVKLEANRLISEPKQLFKKYNKPYTLRDTVEGRETKAVFGSHFIQVFRSAQSTECIANMSEHEKRVYYDYLTYSQIVFDVVTENPGFNDSQVDAEAKTKYEKTLPSYGVNTSIHTLTIDNVVENISESEIIIVGTTEISAAVEVDITDGTTNILATSATVDNKGNFTVTLDVSTLTSYTEIEVRSVYNNNTVTRYYTPTRSHDTPELVVRTLSDYEAAEVYDLTEDSCYNYNHEWEE